jgi:hypothetical protein
MRYVSIVIVAGSLVVSLAVSWLWSGPNALFDRAVAASRDNNEAVGPDDDAAALYVLAEDMIVVGPTGDVWDATHFRQYPPYSETQMRMAALEWDASKHVRDLARKLRSMKRAEWPNPTFVSRNLPQNLSDAANYADVQGDHAQAIEEIRDLIHLADLFEYQPRLVHALSGIGLKAMSMQRLEVIVSGAPMTDDPSNVHDIPVRTARELIDQLLDQPDLKNQLVSGPRPDQLTPTKFGDVNKAVNTTINRITAECDMAAISLACHLFQFDHKRWPNSMEELVPAYLKQPPIDPFGDGKETVSYGLIKGGLPDGSDRPLVYVRDNTANGLFFRLDGPQYANYFGDGTDSAPAYQKHGGQFRDLTRWQPPANRSGPTIQFLR